MSNYDTGLLKLWSEGQERCGFILKDGAVIETINVHSQPQEHFKIADSDMLRYGDSIRATWHTHPKTGPNLSVPDYFMFCRFPEWDHAIISKNAFRIYRAVGARVLICENS